MSPDWATPVTPELFAFIPTRSNASRIAGNATGSATFPSKQKKTGVVLIHRLPVAIDAELLFGAMAAVCDASVSAKHRKFSASLAGGVARNPLSPQAQRRPSLPSPWRTLDSGP